MVEFVGSEHVERENAQGSKRDRAFEKLYFSATLGGAFRGFEDEIERARVKLVQEPKGEWLCQIEVDTFAGTAHAGASCKSRAGAFTRATEQLDRRLTSVLRERSIAAESDLPPERIAA